MFLNFHKPANTASKSSSNKHPSLLCINVNRILYDKLKKEIFSPFASCTLLAFFCVVVRFISGLNNIGSSRVGPTQTQVICLLCKLTRNIQLYQFRNTISNTDLYTGKVIICLLLARTRSRTSVRYVCVSSRSLANVLSLLTFCHRCSVLSRVTYGCTVSGTGAAYYNIQQLF